MDLFVNKEHSINRPSWTEPLAARLRPRDFDEYIGQKHLIAEGKLLRRAIEADSFTAIILYGPPGIGKTSLAELIARTTEAYFHRLSAVTATVKDVRACMEEAQSRQSIHNKRTILFLDEIHRFNRAQQDVLLPFVENGTIRLIGATTENPFFYVVGPLVSRAQVFKLEPLSIDDIRQLILSACEDERGFIGKTVSISEDALAFWAEKSEGDARRILTALELAVLSTEAKDGVVEIDLSCAEESMQQKAIQYGDDGHYDTASAFIKSMRGSDPDAAVYWMAKMLQAGEDPRFIARRAVIFASEDVGNADPRALTLAVNGMQAIEMIGMPEARIILSQIVCYLATAPKSNASYLAVDSAINDITNDRVIEVPLHLRDGHYKGAAKLGHGLGYQYPHDHPGHFVVQDYLGVDRQYYSPTGLGFEAKIKERMEHWQRIRDDVKQGGLEDD